MHSTGKEWTGNTRAPIDHRSPFSASDDDSELISVWPPLGGDELALREVLGRIALASSTLSTVRVLSFKAHSYATESCVTFSIVTSVRQSEARTGHYGKATEISKNRPAMLSLRGMLPREGCADRHALGW
jgi:hypothetical protein